GTPRKPDDDPAEGHVGTLTRTVEREVAQDDSVKPKALPVGVRELLAAKLRDAVRGDRTRLALLGCRVPLRIAVDRRRRREDDPCAGGGGCLEDSSARQQVPAHVLLEDVAEAAHTRLPGEVEDAVDTG